MSGWFRVIGAGTFAYAFQGIPETPHGSVWLFLLYQRVVFFGFTAPREDFQ